MRHWKYSDTEGSELKNRSVVCVCAKVTSKHRTIAKILRASHPWKFEAKAEDTFSETICHLEL